MHDAQEYLTVNTTMPEPEVTTYATGDVVEQTIFCGLNSNPR